MDNKNIKEILEYLKDDKKISFGSFGTEYKRIELNDIKLLLDYITNLQQEIEKLNNDKRGMLVQLYKANDEKDKLKQENERLNINIQEKQYLIDNVAELIGLEEGSIAEELYDKLKELSKESDKDCTD